MNWWPFGKETAAKDGPHTLLDEIEKRGKQYVDDVDNGKLISPACKRTASDAGHDQAAIADHTRLEAFRYLLRCRAKNFACSPSRMQQAALLDGYLRQLPHEDMVIEFTGVTHADLAIAIIAGFNWLVHCAVSLAPRPISFTARCATSAGSPPPRKNGGPPTAQRSAMREMLQAQQEPPLFLNLVWADYSRMAEEIAAAHAARQ